MSKERTRWNITSLAALLAFAVFTLCALLVVLSGARVYQNLTHEAQRRSDNATVARYLTTRLHQSDSAGAIRLETFGDTQALVICSQHEQELYETRIYCHDGWLYELFSAPDAGLSPEDGERLLPLEKLSFDWQQPLLTMTFTDPQGASQTLQLALRTEQAVIP